jgi:hypothetical protein
MNFEDLRYIRDPSLLPLSLYQNVRSTKRARASALEAAEIEAGVLHPLDHLGEHLDPRAAAVPVSHVPAGPPEQTVNDIARGPGPAQSIGEGMAQ